ncbi:MAG: heavy metal translocating P-type ATPase metal-binding domain-containing protein [Methylobacter sp.]
MVIIEYKEFCAFCALCGQPVEIKGFTLNTPEAQKHFCCAGCLSIYQLLNEKQYITTHNPPTTTK